MKSISRPDLTPGNTIHCFEAAKLGKAPYAFLGVREFKFKAAPEAPTQPGTCCDYCGTGIMYAFMLRSADGKEFKVGCDCIEKSGDKGLRKIISQLEKEKRQKKAQEKRQKELDRRNEVKREIEEILANNPKIVESLKSKPHPSIPRYTLLNYVEWMLIYAGVSGMFTVREIIKKEGA
jgi:hypothetical protein